ncbi:hypothetical protein H0W91_03900 [Patescibacteria group bacterium]|nr:hypothetical protein [Patescibacteria group bacterium]
MKEYLNKILKIYKDLKSKHSSYERQGINPANDWKLLLMLVTLILFILAIYAFYLYSQIEQGTIYTINNPVIEKNIKLNTALFDKTVEDINKRAEIYSNTVNNKSIPNDPAL